MCFRPNLECLVGVDSADTSELYKVNCNNAWNISVKLDKKKANALFAENYISDQDRIRRIVRFGIQGSGIKFEAKHQWKRWGNVDNWVCAYQPILNTVIYDCIPENQAPNWWKKALMGPAFSSGMVGAVKEPKSPGCNGGVCYCNDKDFCNDRYDSDDDEVAEKHEKFFRTGAVEGMDDCPDYLESFRLDVRCKDYKEEPEE